MHFLLLASAASAASAADRTLLAESTDTRLWLAEVAPASPTDSSRITTIYTRQMQDSKWQRGGTISAPALSIHDLQGELAVLLTDGSWRLVRPAGASQEADQRIGQRAPGSIRAMASDGQTLWAICMIPGGMEAATAPPATRPNASAPTTRPKRVPEVGPISPASLPATTRAADSSSAMWPSPVLYTLHRGVWRPIADVPAEIVPGGPAACATLAVIGATPTIAVSPLGQDVQIHWLSADGWRHDTISTPPDIQFLHIVGRRGSSAASVCAITTSQWMVCSFTVGASEGISYGPSALAATSPTTVASSAVGITSTLPAGPAMVTLTGPSPMPAPAEVAITSTMASDLRFIYRPAKSKALMERLYSPAGQPTTSAQALALPSGPPPSSQVQNIFLMLSVAITLILLSSLRRRPTEQQVQHILRRVRPAPLGRRAAAGLIDLSPALLAAIVTMWQMPPSTQGSADFFELVATPIAGAGIGLYLLHTTLVEVFLGRSVGKILLGLTVATTDGTPAGRMALLVRNLLRLVDVIIFPPLALMAAFSPVHQRLADVVAGTLVIIPGEPAAPEPEEAVTSEPDESDEDREE